MAELLSSTERVMAARCYMSSEKGGTNPRRLAIAPNKQSSRDWQKIDFRPQGLPLQAIPAQCGASCGAEARARHVLPMFTPAASMQRTKSPRTQEEMNGACNL